MKLVRLWLLVILSCGATVTPAGAEDLLVDGPDGCAAINGEWQIASYSCLVHSLVVGSEDTLIVAVGTGLRSDGPIFNYGRMDVRGTFRLNAAFSNRGTLETSGLTVNQAPITNSGTYINYGWLHTEGGLENYGFFENRGLFETCMGALVNHAYMHNVNDIANWGGLIVNNGITVNDGSLYNPDGSYYVVNNGAFENRRTVENWGTVTSTCGSAFYGAGSVLGNPVAHEPCNPAQAVQLLTSRLFELGVQGRLSKAEVKRLTGYTGKATKALIAASPGSALVELHTLIGDVQALLDAQRLPEYIAHALIGWAEAIVELISS
jgi:hypothetical protein